ncbi:MAG: hypothetical protein AAF547_09175 [Actinomycetota bacterium]
MESQDQHRPDRQRDTEASGSRSSAEPIGRADKWRPTRPGPSFPEEAIRVTAWADPVLDNLGHDPRSPYVERFWLPILGPSCVLLLRRLAADLERSPDGFLLETARLAPALGIGMKGGRNGPLWRAVERACRFGAAQRNGELLAVRRRLPPLTARQTERLPADLAAEHARWAEQRLVQPRRQTIATWSERRDRQTPAGTSSDEVTPLDDAA